MGSAHLYFPGERLSAAELASACLDGHLVALGDAYIPADAVETAALRAGSLRELLRDVLAAIGPSAAWIHGVGSGPPARHRVQRVAPRRLHAVIDRRLEYHDTLLPARARQRIGGVWVTTPARTAADLLRTGSSDDERTARAMIAAGLATIADTAADLHAAGPLPGKRAALRRLRRPVSSR